MFRKIKLFFARRKLGSTKRAFMEADGKLAAKQKELNQVQQVVNRGGDDKEWDKFKKTRKKMKDEYDELKPQSAELHRLSSEYGRSAYSNYHELNNKSLAHEFRVKKEAVQARMHVVDARQKSIESELKTMKNPKQVIEQKHKKMKIDAEQLLTERNKTRQELERASNAVALLEGASKPDGWGELIQGSIKGNEVTAKVGYGKNEGHVLIADGILSGKQFSMEDLQGVKNHNHYGDNREKHGRVEDNLGKESGSRGKYTGPGA